MKKYGFLSILVWISGFVNAQTPGAIRSLSNANSTLNFYDYQLQSNTELLNPTGILDSFEIKQYRRFEYFWKDRAAPVNDSLPGNFFKANSALKSFLQQPVCNTNLPDHAWGFVGPVGVTGHKKGIVTALYVNPTNDNDILAGSGASGIWRTLDHGQNWRCVTDEEHFPGLGITSIVKCGNRIFASTGISNGNRGYGIGLIYSDDGGEAWQILSSFPTPNGRVPIVRKLAVSGNTIIAVSELSVYKSTDFGNSWTDISPTSSNTLNYLFIPGQSWADIDINPTAPNELYLSGADEGAAAQLLKSTDGGISYQNVTSQIQSSLYNSISNFGFQSGTAPNPNIPSWVEDPEWDLIFLGGGNQAAGIYPLVNAERKLYRLPGVITVGNQYPFAVCFDAFIPANCELKIQLTNSNNSSLVFPVYNSGFVTANTTLTSNCINLISNDYYDVIEIIAVANTSYQGVDQLWVDNVKFFDNSKRRIATTYNTASEPFLCVVGLSSVTVYSFDGLNQQFDARASLGNGPVPSFFKCEFESSPGNADIMYLGGIDLFSYDNSTQSFANLGNTGHDDIRSILVTSPGNIGSEGLVVGSDGGVASSSNSGTTWTSINGIGLNIEQFYGFDVTSGSAPKICGGTQDNGDFSFDNSWSNSTHGDGGKANIDDNDDNFYDINIAVPGEVVNSPNYGSTFSTIFTFSGSDGAYLGMPYELSPSEIGVQYAGTTTGLFKSVTNGTSFSQIVIPNASGIVSAIGVHPVNAQVIYVAQGYPTADPQQAQYRLFRTIDGGVTWTNITDNNIVQSYNYGTITSFAFDPANDQKVWVGFGGIYFDPNQPTSVSKRVLYSSNQGNSFADHSAGLTYFPINDLIYQNNSDDILYAATDVGIYTWNNSNNTWECFSNNLPICIVSDLEINYCTQELYASTFGRGIWRTNLLPGNLTTISGNVIWSSPVAVDYDLLVTANSTLTLTSDLEMSNGRKIMIEQGGNLIVNGGTISGHCGKMWQGIEVWGDRTLDQTGTHQGQITVKNGAIIQDAKDAITTCRKDPQGNIDFSSTGGRIYAEHSTFRNNRRDIEFLSYTAQPGGNVSRFVDVTFTTTSALNEPTVYPLTHVSMWDVHGVKFTQCVFSNTTLLSDFTVDKRGKGIFTVDATFNVQSACNPPQPPGVTCPISQLVHGQFIGLHTGIESMSSNPLNTLEVDGNAFTGNQFGILLQGIDYAKITRNTFDIPGLLSIDYPYGLYLKQCRNYEVEENVFSHAGNPDINVGIAVLNSGIRPAEIYNNKFLKLYVGELPMGLNRNIFSFLPGFGNGLQMRCNESVGNEWDFAVTLNGSIALNQGAPTNTVTLAGNRFSHNCVGFDNDYWGQTMPGVIYWSHSNIPPVCYSNSTINLQNIGIPFVLNNPELSCPSSISTGTNPDQHKMLMYQYKLLTETEAQKIDANNTQGLLDAVATQSSGLLKNTLLDASPYLSDEVLIAAINKGLPPGIIKQILMANSPLSPDVLALVNTMNYPAGIMKQIQSVQSGISERTKLESEISFYQAEQEKEMGDFIRYYLLSDTSGTGLDSVVKIFKDEGSPMSKCMEIAAMIKNQQYTDVQLKLMDHLSEPEDYFCKLLNLILQFEQTLEKCYSADASDRAMLGDLATKDPKYGVCVKAQTLLEMILGTDYPEPIELPYLSQYHSPTFFNDSANAGDNYVKIYPNPTNGIFTFEYKLPDENTNLVFEVYDITGRALFTIPLAGNEGKLTRDLSHVTNGIYFYSILSDKNRLESGKIIITK